MLSPTLPPPPPTHTQITDFQEEGVFLRVFYTNLALLHLSVLLLPFIDLLQNEHTTRTENGEM